MRAWWCLLIVALVSAGCVDTLEHAYYETKFQDAHGRLLDTMRGLDEETRAYEGGEISGADLDAAEAEAEDALEDVRAGLREPWPPSWSDAVSRLDAAADRYGDVVDPLVTCARSRGTLGSVCSQAFRGIMDVFTLLSDASEAKPAP